uniref:60S ribosome subunit biogenesis protein NIP7 homolog n=1 Tax=Strigamia maritima TaxID=126957 RepID=T1JEE3_STRMM
MRPLTTQESEVFFDKLSKYVGENIRLLVDRPDGTYCFRFHNNRVFYVSHKVWLKASAEQQYLYGHHVMKSGLGRITEATTRYQGVVVYSMNDLPLGFGVAAKSTQDCRTADPMTIVCLHQSDIGEYIRNEENLV